MARRLSSISLTILASFVALKAALCLLSSFPMNAAFVRGPAQQLASTQRIQRQAISDAERAAVLRLPTSATAARTEEDGISENPDMSAERRRALRMPSADDQAKLIKEMEDREYMEEVMMQERSMWDGSAFGGPITAMYYMAFAGCFASIFFNLYTFVVTHA